MELRKPSWRTETPRPPKPESMLARLVELLGRLIGDDMAMKLIERSLVSDARRRVFREQEGGGVKKEEGATIRSIPSGVPGLDSVLGGGLPEYSFNLIAGGPGSGKTTLAHQIMFSNATVERPALYFTVLGEPTIKMLRYQRQFSYFDPKLAGSAIQFINLSAEVMERTWVRFWTGSSVRSSAPNRESSSSIHFERSAASMVAPSGGHRSTSTNSFSASRFT